jgi:hypothetical protein
MVGDEMSDRDLLISIQSQLNDYLRAVTPPENAHDIVRRLYLEVLNREPDAGGWDYWARRLDDGMSVDELRAALRASIPHPPPLPPSSTGSDLSDGAQHTFQFYEGQAQAFSFRCSGGVVELTVFPPAGTTAKVGYWSVNGGPEQSFAASGTDFRFKPISGFVDAGTVTVVVRITGIIGAGQFALQAVGAVG